MKKQKRKNKITYLCIVAFYLFIVAGINLGFIGRHLQAVLIPVGINMILAMSLNLIVGFLGELTLGHAGFMSVGAYGGSLFAIATADALPDGVRFVLAMAVGAVVAMVFGVIIGIPVLRLKGDYLAIVTLAFGEIIRSVILNLKFTGGAAGLKGTPNDTTLFWVYTVVLVCAVFIGNFTTSQQGRQITAVRDNVIAAEACGVPVTACKLTAFVVAAAFAGVAGVLYSHNISVLTASVFDYNRSIEILVIVVLGGMGSLRGSIISAAVVTLLPEMLRFVGDYRLLIYSVVLIIAMLLGNNRRFAAMWGELKMKLNRRTQKLKSRFGRKKGAVTGE